MKFVFFKGEKGHGKTTAARALERNGYVHLNFADPVKEVAMLVYGLTREEIDDPILKEKPLDRWPFRSPREIMQKIGTEMFRNYQDETWVRNFDRRAEDALRAQHFIDSDGAHRPLVGVVCSDLRFPNEAAYVHSKGGVIIEVFDPRKPSGVDGHVSEVGAKAIIPHWRIINDRGVEDLHHAVEMLVLGQ